MRGNGFLQAKKSYRTKKNWATARRSGYYPGTFRLGNQDHDSYLGRGYPRGFLIPGQDARLALKHGYAPLSACHAPLLGSLSAALATKGWKRDPPKAICGIVPFDKLDSISGQSLRNSQLCDYAG